MMLPYRVMKPEADMEKLPEELKLEILLCLPARSLLSLKRVSQSWYSRISNPNFAKLHLRLSNYSQYPNRILVTTSPQMRSIDINASLHDDSDTFNLVSPTLKPFIWVCVVGSCRGIVLLYIANKDFFLWNPVTSAYKNVPLPGRFISPIPFAFCYDEYLDDYFIGLSYHPGHSSPQVFEVLSLRTNSWEKLDLTHHYRRWFQNRGTIFNGAIHFLAYTSESHTSLELIAFDITTKDLRVVPPPTYTDLKFCLDLGVHKGCLSLTEVRDNNEIHLWLMKEYGVESSWTKLFSLSRRHFGTISFFHLLVFFKEDDEFVTSYFAIHGWQGLLKWNVRGELLEHRTYDPSPLSNIELWSCAIAYTETLLPLP